MSIESKLKAMLKVNEEITLIEIYTNIPCSPLEAKIK
jgi:hypothetical protein